MEGRVVISAILTGNCRYVGGTLKNRGTVAPRSAPQSSAA